MMTQVSTKLKRFAAPYTQTAHPRGIVVHVALPLLFMVVAGIILGWFLQPVVAQRHLATVHDRTRASAHGFHPVVQIQRSSIDTLPQATTTSPARRNTMAATNGPLRLNPVNPRYFADASGQTVYLTGSHTWASLQDNGNGDPPPRFDYDQYLDFLEANNHNFFRLWSWEESRWTTETSDPDYWFNPDPPFQRTGPGLALDGKAKFDVTKLEQAYFDRMRERIRAAQERGIYVSIMLFNGWSVANTKGGLSFNNPWAGHPLNAANNINGLNGDPDQDDSGLEVHTLAVPAITAVQEAYVKKVIDTVNDLDNVLYEISNESEGNSTEWQYHMINFVKTYEATKPYQHPVGMTVEYFGGDNDTLFQSPADWISPNGPLSDPLAGDGRKVILYDTDHLCGICGDRRWVWMAFTRGLNPIFMDGYDGAGYGVGGVDFAFDDPTWVSLRQNLGYTRAFANRMNLAAMTPQTALASSGYALAKATSPNAEYLVYLPDGGTVTVDLRAVNGSLTVEWFNPDLGTSTTAGAVDGGATRTLIAPFVGDAVLYLVQQGGIVPPTNTPLLTPTPNTTSALAQLGNRVWNDTNWNGIQDTGEPGVFGITVNLLNGCSDTFVLQSRLTDSDGYYGFNKLIPGQYRLQVSKLPAGYTFSPQNQGTNEATDSDINPATGISDCMIVAAGRADNWWDSGLYLATSPTATPTSTPLTATAQVGNRIWLDANRNGIYETSEMGVPGVTITLLRGCSGTTALGTRTSDGNGYFGFANLAAGSYRFQVSNLPAGYSFSPQNQGTNEAADSDINPATGLSDCIALTAGQSDNRWDTGLYLATSPTVTPTNTPSLPTAPPTSTPASTTAQVGNRVWNDENRNGIYETSETGAGGVTITLLPGCSGTIAQGSRTSDGNGYFGFAKLPAGQVRLQVSNLPSGYAFSPQNQGANDAIDSDVNPATGISDCITLAADQSDNRWDTGIMPWAALASAIGDRVWLDSNGDGLFTTGESGVANINLNLLSSCTGSAIVANTTTNGSGLYNFANLAAGQYRIQVNLPEGYRFSLPNQGADDANDSDINTASSLSDCITLGVTQSDNRWDVGLKSSQDVGTAAVGDRIWEDLNNDGLQDSGEPGLPGAKVGLYSNGALLLAQVADAGGSFLFANLTPGSYYLCFQRPVTPLFYGLTMPLQGTDRTLDSNPDPGTGCTTTFTLRAGQLERTQDAGFFNPPATLAATFQVTAVDDPEIDANLLLSEEATADPDHPTATDGNGVLRHRLYLPMVTQP